MTNFRIERRPFTIDKIRSWDSLDKRHLNWPVVYTLDNESDIYVGESRNAALRMRQHLDNPDRQHLTNMRVVIDDTFNKSAALDLESYLIRFLFGDGKYRVLNRNGGITDADYFNRAAYQGTFDAIFQELFDEGVFTRTIPEIINGDLFKFSPFKELNTEQAVAVDGILHALFDDLDQHTRSTIVVQGDPGTGKTIVAIYLMKLLMDIATSERDEEPGGDALFSDFFVSGYREQLDGFRIGLVVPQQSLRKSIEKVFAKTPGLSKDMVMTPFEVGKGNRHFDLLIVDETHRLNHRANQPSGPQNKSFGEINTALFGADDDDKTQLDWIRAKSTHQIFLVDQAQSVRPADLPTATLRELVSHARQNRHFYPLPSQMRVQGGTDYVEYVRRIFSGKPPTPRAIHTYEFVMFDDLSAMQSAIRKKDVEVGLARLVAGYAWPWVSKSAPDEFDIELDGCRLRWNKAATDWINSAGALEEVGSIHTVQGYDLNYAGVIIGPDLRYDPQTGNLVFDRENHHDKKGKENNPKRGIVYTDDDLLRFVTNIYGVLLTRGIRGTYVYVCDPHLREYLRAFISV